MAKLIVRRVRDGDLESIAAGLRAADRDEIAATVGDVDALTVLREGAERSALLWTIQVDNEPAGLFGVAPLNQEIAVPWMLGTYAIERAPKQLTKLGRTYVRLMLDKYETLVNYVDARNLKSIYWLTRLGFTVCDKPEPFGAFGMPFHRFGMKR